MKNPLESIPEPSARRWIVVLAVATALVWAIGIALKLITPYL